MKNLLSLSIVALLLVLSSCGDKVVDFRRIDFNSEYVCDSADATLLGVDGVVKYSSSDNGEIRRIDFIPKNYTINDSFRNKIEKTYGIKFEDCECGDYVYEYRDEYFYYNLSKNKFIIYKIKN